MKREATKGIRLATVLAGIGWAGLAMAAEDAEGPEAKIRSPRAGEEVEHSFEAKGRTRNVPEGHLIILFRPVKDGEFLWPATGAIKANRSFSETIQHEKRDDGKHVLEVHMVREDIAEKIAEWRANYIQWYEAGKLGPEPGFVSSWFEHSKRLAQVDYQLEE